MGMAGPHTDEFEQIIERHLGTSDLTEACVKARQRIRKGRDGQRCRATLTAP